MELESNYERELIYSITSNEPLSIQSISQHVNEFQRMHELESLEKLTVQISVITPQITEHQKHWCLTADLMEEVQIAIASLRKALEVCISEATAAGNELRSFRRFTNDKKCENSNSG